MCYAFHSQHKSAGHTIENVIEHHRVHFAAFEGNSHYIAKMCDVEQLKIKLRTCWDKAPEARRVLYKGYVISQAATPGWDRRSCEYFTLFRDPVARLVSAFFYCRHAPSDPLCGTRAMNPRNATLHQFADHWGNFLFRELLWYPPILNKLFPRTGEKCDVLCQARQTSMPKVTRVPYWYVLKVALRGGDDPRTPQGTANLDLVLAHLRGLYASLGPMFDVLGILEQWNQTMQLWDRRMPLEGNRTWLGSTGKSTHGSGQWKKKELEALVQARADPYIREALQGDLKIYHEAAVPLFEAAWRSAQ